MLYKQSRNIINIKKKAQQTVLLPLAALLLP